MSTQGTTSGSGSPASRTADTNRPTRLFSGLPTTARGAKPLLRDGDEAVFEIPVGPFGLGEVHLDPERLEFVAQACGHLLGEEVVVQVEFAEMCEWLPGQQRTGADVAEQPEREVERGEPSDHRRAGECFSDLVGDLGVA